MYALFRFASHRCIGVFDSIEKLNEVLPKNIDAEHYIDSRESFVFDRTFCFIDIVEVNKILF